MSAQRSRTETPHEAKPTNHTPYLCCNDTILFFVMFILFVLFLCYSSLRVFVCHLSRFRSVGTANLILYFVHLSTPLVNGINRGFGEVSSTDCLLRISSCLLLVFYILSDRLIIFVINGRRVMAMCGKIWLLNLPIWCHLVTLGKIETQLCIWIGSRLPPQPGDLSDQL